MTNTQFKRFKRFLKDEGVFKAYMSYINISKGRGGVKRFLKSCSLDMPLLDGFCWAATKEEAGFWSKLHDQWCKLNGER